MKFEIKRKIDELGRIVLPIDLRRYYGIENGDTIVLLPVRDGIQVAKADYFILNQLSPEMAATIDELGRFVMPSTFRTQYHIEPKDTINIVPHETCILLYKEDASMEDVGNS